MTDLYLLEPAPGPAWFPFSDCRPVAELRAGAWLIRERWEAIAGGETRAVFAPPHLHHFVEDGAPPITAQTVVDGPAMVGCSEFVPAGTPVEIPSGAARLTHEGSTVGWSVPRGARWERNHPDWPGVEVDGLLLRGAYDLVTALEELLPADTADFTVERGDPVPDGCTVIGDPGDIVLIGATVEPGVVFDTREGAIVLEQGVYAKSGTRLEGPVYVAAGSELLGGQIRWCSIGPRCKVRGEQSNTAFIGLANKAHDGFVGHSLVGRWVNLGAGTTTSNLKNTYGKVRLDIAGQPLDTERQYLGTLFGDHVKTAIGTMFGTGTVVGTGANVFGDVRPPKFVRPFAWGSDGKELLERAGFLATAERMLARRKAGFTEEVQQMLAAIYQHATRIT